MDLDWSLWHEPVPSTRQSFFLHEGFCKADRPHPQGIQTRYPFIPDPPHGSIICCLVFLHDQILSDALASGIFGNGDALLSFGKRDCSRDLPDFWLVYLQITVLSYFDGFPPVLV